MKPSERLSWLAVAAIAAFSVATGGGLRGCNLPDIIPAVDPAPFPSDTLRVWLVEESNDRTPAVRNVTASTIWREYVKQKGGEFRVLDRDADVSGDTQVWQEAFKLPRPSLPWFVVTNGRTGVQGPLPKTPEEFLGILKKYGGQ